MGPFYFKLLDLGIPQHQNFESTQLETTLVKQIARAAALGAAIVIGCGLSAPSAWAGYIVTLTQQETTFSPPEADQST